MLFPIQRNFNHKSYQNNNMKNRIKLEALIVGIFLLLLGQCQKQIFIDTTTDDEEMVMFNMFNGIENGYYADIGAYDPMYQSNTFNLHSQGWSGVNVDANHSRIQKFIYQRAEDTNLHLAVASSEKILTFYESVDDSASTASEKVRNSQPSTFVGSSQVHALPLGEICRRYFLAKPKFMNLDVEGLGYEALASNDWQNPKCYPEVISSEWNYLNKVENENTPENLLKSYGYIKVNSLPEFNLQVGNQIFIHKDYINQYSQRYELNKIDFLNEKEIHNIYEILHKLELLINLKIMSNQPAASHVHARHSFSEERYSSAGSDVYLHVARNGDQLDLLQVNKHSNLISAKQNRPIVVLNFNPHKSLLILPDDGYKMQEFPTGIYNFLLITLLNPQQKQIKVFILDQQYSKPEQFSQLPPHVDKIPQINKKLTITNTHQSYFIITLLIISLIIFLQILKKYYNKPKHQRERIQTSEEISTAVQVGNEQSSIN